MYEIHLNKTYVSG